MTDQIDEVPQAAALPIDLRRYRRVRWFFFRIFLHTLWWDILLNRPLLRIFRTPALPRWRKIARRFRRLAVEMGGVLIKLGQFLSIRVDILPAEVTNELKDLQDEVPPEPAEAIIRRIESELGRPLGDIFPRFSSIPLGAASIAQAHAVILPSGEKAVVKVLRPGIEQVVETDLKAVGMAVQWLKWYKPVRRCVDLDWLYDEFRTVTRRELDFRSEAGHAEQLADDFSGDERIYIPHVFKEYSSRKVLTLEDVGYIKITDTEAVESAGISRVQVADILFQLYMQQIFETHFVHVDPHPGNLFVRPMPTPDEAAAGQTSFAPGENTPYCPDRPFQIAFIDFGMMTPIPPRLRTALREYAIALGTQDAHRMVQSYIQAGGLLPGADLKRLVEAHEALFERLWGLRVGSIKDVALDEARFFMKEYRDVIRESPFQFQADMLFVVRAVGMLSGMAAHLDPDFDVWSKTLPFAEKYAKEALRTEGRERLKKLIHMSQKLMGMPNRIAAIIDRAEQGKLSFENTLSPEVRKNLQNISRSVDRLGWRVLAASLLISGAVVRVSSPADPLWKICAAGALFSFFWSGRE